MKARLSRQFFLGCALLAASSAQAQPANKKAPPQFVILAFDGSKSIKMWEDTRLFARDLGIRFTYFINTPYFIKKSKANVYTEPTRGPGKICLTWGDTITPNYENERWRDEEIALEQQYFKNGNGEDIILRRMELMNQAYQDGHEIAIHAVGHCNGEKFSTEQWVLEFQQFYNQLFNYIGINGLTNKARQVHYPYFRRTNLIGFRAPELAMTKKHLWPALNVSGINYDTTEVKSSKTWPFRTSNGHWAFPLADIQLAGTAKWTLSMDYNFYMAQSGAKPVRDPNLIRAFENQMYDSYMNYFWSNYSGNRAPVHIGHHFSRWNEGAYWRAFQRFARDVCGLPEVKCVSYKELLDYVEKNESQIPTFQTSKYPAPVRRPSSESPTFEMNLTLDAGPKGFKAKLGDIYAINPSAETTDNPEANRSLASAMSMANVRWTLDGIELVQARGKEELPTSDVENLLKLTNKKNGLLQVSYFRDPTDVISFQTRTLAVNMKGKKLTVGNSVLENEFVKYEGGHEFGFQVHE